MKALTKGQYEALAGAINDTWRITKEINTKRQDRIKALLPLSTFIELFIELARESDPEFKRELFLKQCGVTE